MTLWFFPEFIVKYVSLYSLCCCYMTWGFLLLQKISKASTALQCHVVPSILGSSQFLFVIYIQGAINMVDKSKIFMLKWLINKTAR